MISIHFTDVYIALERSLLYFLFARVKYHTNTSKLTKLFKAKVFDEISEKKIRGEIRISFNNVLFNDCGRSLKQ